MGFYPYNKGGALEVQERDSTNATVRECTWGLNLGGGIGGLLAILTPGSGLFTPVYDGKGNVSAVLDAAQAPVVAYGYDEFGVLTATTGSLDQPFRFSTKSYDPQTGLAYFGYRFYSPALGRWLNRDPISEAGGLNVYAFVGNNPMNGTDPFGLFTSQWHYLVSYVAMWLTGHGELESSVVAGASIYADFRSGAKTNPAWHAMRNKDVCEDDARRDTADYVADLLNQGGLLNLGYALHAMEDANARGHNFNVDLWNGQYSLSDPTFVNHLIGDLTPYPSELAGALLSDILTIMGYEYAR